MFEDSVEYSRGETEENLEEHALISDSPYWVPAHVQDRWIIAGVSVSWVFW